jgi:hypothetical protein
MNNWDYLGKEVLGIVAKAPEGSWNTYIAVEGNVCGFIIKEQYYIVSSVFDNGKSNMMVQDYHVTLLNSGLTVILSDIIFKDKGNLFNTEGKERMKRTLSLILSAGGPLAYLGKANKAATAFGTLSNIDTAIGTGGDILKDITNQEYNWTGWAWEASGFIPIWSIAKSGVDLTTYSSRSLEPFEFIHPNGFEHASVSDAIDLRCKIKRDGVSYKKISEAIRKHHGFVEM